MMKVIARLLRLVTLLTVGWGLQAQAQPTDFSLPPLPSMGTSNPNGLTGSMPPLPNLPIPPNAGAKKQTPAPSEVADQPAPAAIPELANLPTPVDPAAPVTTPTEATADTTATAPQSNTEPVAPTAATAPALPPMINEGGDMVAGEGTAIAPTANAGVLNVAAPPTSLPGLFPAAPPGATQTAALPSFPAATSLPEISVDVPSAPKTRTWKTTLAPAVIPPKTNFNYRRQILPDAIYRKQYDKENRHLPLQVTRSDYSRLLIERVAANDINGTRALLNTGMSVNTTDGYGQSLLSVARRTGARDTERLLIARGAS